jgi:hypothetical protein
VRLQRHKDGGLCDVKTFRAAAGLRWIDAAGHTATLAIATPSALQGVAATEA